MTATTLEDRKNHGSVGGIELLDQSVDEVLADKRVINETQEHAVCAGREAAERGLKGTEVTLLPLLVDHNLAGVQVDGFCDRFSVGAQYHAADTYLRVMRDFEQMLEERSSLIGEEGFRGAHSS